VLELVGVLLDFILNNNMNKKGYTTTNHCSYEVEINNITYYVQVDVKYFVKPADYDSWSSDYDYYGWTEVQNVKITNIFTEDENGIENEVQFSQLSKQLQKEIDAALDVLVLQ